MKNVLKDIAKSFKDRPVWTVWSIAWAPFIYTSIFVAASLIALVNFSINDGVEFWNDAT